MFRIKILLIFGILMAALVPPSSADTSKEERLGLELARQLEQNVTLVTDAAVIERIARIGQKIAAVAESNEATATYGSPTLADFHYVFKVIDSKDINALSLPGGKIYINKGLIDFAVSDDELAGVLAHEIAHASHHHVLDLSKRQSKMDIVIALIALAGGIGGMDGRDLTNIVYGAQSVRTAKLTGYGREAEFDADRTGVFYTMKAGYDPLALIWFLNRLLHYQEERGDVRDLGIFQTHPPTKERVVRLAEACAAMGIEVDFRKVAHLSKAEVVESSIDGKQLYSVMIAGKQVCVSADTAKATSRERAEHISRSINNLLYKGLEPEDIQINIESAELRCFGNAILALTPEDCVVCGADKRDILERAASAIRYAIWSDWVKSHY